MEELIFLDFEEFRKLKNYDGNNIILLDYPPKDFLEFPLELIEKHNIEEFYPNNLLKNVEKRSEALLERFYYYFENKFFYKNIDLSSLIKNYLSFYFVTFVKYVDILNYIIKNNRPRRVFITYHKNEKNHIFMDNSELFLSVIKEICSVNKISIKVKVIKKKKNLLNIGFKDIFITILGILQNIYAKLTLSKNNQKKNILFVGGKNAYLSILKHLKGKAKILRCGINPGLSFLNAYQDHYLTFWNKPKYESINFPRDNFDDNIKNIKYKGYSFYKIFLGSLNYLFNVYFKIIIRWIDTSYDVEPHIDAVVATNDILPLEQIIIKVLKQNKKKSYLIEHGYTTLSDNLFLVEDKKFKMLADKMFVWGKESKEWMIKQGLKKEDLIITGSPKFDSYYSKENINLRKEFNIPADKKIILFIAPTNKEGDRDYPKYFLSNREHTELYRTIFHTIKKMKEFILIIKPHPSDSHVNLPKKILETENVSNVIIVDKNFQLKPLLKQSDLIISAGSTVNLEAMFFKKPVIILNFFNKPKSDPFIDNGMCLGLSNKNQLKETILKAFENKEKLVRNYSKYFNNYALSDGKAYKRISDVILKN
ncbi:MAG: Ribosomal protein L35 [archaeon GW2011_AR20]|nr:MAG: Ribosomal protein L35 [archaeon GW2011_AR20]AQS28188.1 hypothetical protein [uncultured archaeon]MBS3160518.1 CDP-glycerol glycerophosphotransferase family protein [Candidatus Woesearchaeota archaeon]